MTPLKHCLKKPIKKESLVKKKNTQHLNQTKTYSPRNILPIKSTAFSHPKLRQRLRLYILLFYENDSCLPSLIRDEHYHHVNNR